MSIVKNHDKIHLLIPSTHTNRHETNLYVYKITIEVILVYIFDCHAKEVLYPLMIYV